MFVFYIWDFITVQYISFMMNLIYYIHHSDSFGTLLAGHGVLFRYCHIIPLCASESNVCTGISHISLAATRNFSQCWILATANLTLIQQDRRKRRLMRTKKGLEQKETVLINQDQGQLNNSMHLFYANMPIVNKTKLVTQPLLFKLQA